MRYRKEMVVTKRYARQTCKIYTISKTHGKEPVRGSSFWFSFFHFPRQKTNQQKRDKACRGDSFVCPEDSHVCSTHFVCGNETTSQNSILATALVKDWAQFYKTLIAYPIAYPSYIGILLRNMFVGSTYSSAVFPRRKKVYLVVQELSSFVLVLET